MEVEKCLKCGKLSESPQTEKLQNYYHWPNLKVMPSVIHRHTSSSANARKMHQATNTNATNENILTPEVMAQLGYYYHHSLESLQDWDAEDIAKVFRFQTREEYLRWRAVWRITLRNIELRIRYERAVLKNTYRVYSGAEPLPLPPIPEDILLRSYYWSDLARNLLNIRRISKLIAASQYEAEKLKKAA